VVTDGEQARYDFNLVHAFLEGIEPELGAPALGPPAHDQRPRHHIGELRAPGGSASSRVPTAP
jgi:hypothetical protein